MIQSFGEALVSTGQPRVEAETLFKIQLLSCGGQAVLVGQAVSYQLSNQFSGMFAGWYFMDRRLYAFKTPQNWPLNEQI
jgi:hypothetical protein